MEDNTKLNFPFLFGKRVVLMPTPHPKYDLFDFELVKRNSTLTF